MPDPLVPKSAQTEAYRWIKERQARRVQLERGACGPHGAQHCAECLAAHDAAAFSTQQNGEEA